MKRLFHHDHHAHGPARPEAEVPLLKTVTFGAVHMSVAFAIGYALTGSLLLGGLTALIEPLCNTAAYHVHERVWARLRAGKARPAASEAAMMGGRFTAPAA